MYNQSSPSTPEKQVTITYNLHSPYGEFDSDFIIQVIRTNQYRAIVTEIRKLKAEGKTEAANLLKKSLPAASFSCYYVKRRCEQNVTSYSGIVTLDADHLSASAMARVIAMLPACAYVYAYFVSPSGDGLKILVRTNGRQANHRQTYIITMDYFGSLLGILFDPHCTDITRLTFLSWDPQAYLNPDSEIFDVSNLIPLPALKPTLRFPIRPSFSFPRPSQAATSIIFERCVVFLNKYQQYEVGNRNNYSYALARKLKRFNIDYDDALAMMRVRYDLPERELTCCVRSAYKRK